jgi:hypothetical protein
MKITEVLSQNGHCMCYFLLCRVYDKARVALIEPL